LESGGGGRGSESGSSEGSWYGTALEASMDSPQRERDQALRVPFFRGLTRSRTVRVHSPSAGSSLSNGSIERRQSHISHASLRRKKK
jgi:hypothetical protein